MTELQQEALEAGLFVWAILAWTIAGFGHVAIGLFVFSLLLIVLAVLVVYVLVAQKIYALMSFLCDNQEQFNEYLELLWYERYRPYAYRQMVLPLEWPASKE